MIDVERSSIAPPSLARGTSWSGEDVIEALHRDFLGKCYLCESTVAIGRIEVDHRFPRHLDIERLHHFEWANLFPTCSFCNRRRPKDYPECGLLNPGSDRVETQIEQGADPMSTIDEVVCWFRARDPADACAQATALELQHLHTIESTTTFRARAATRELLVAVRLRYAQHVFPLASRARVSPVSRTRSAISACRAARLRASAT